MRRLRSVSFVVLAAVLVSCGDKVKVSGRFAGAADQNVYLEVVSPTLKAVVDSTRSDSRGGFSLRAELPDGQPAIYNLVCKEQTIPLLLSPRERVTVNSIYGIGMNYTVKGSPGSDKLRELGLIFFNGQSSLDSLRSLYASKDHQAQRKDLALEFSRTYYRIKREQIRFIVDNCHSLAAIYALYQRLPNDNNLVDGTNDVIYYSMVADSVATACPDSPYLAALRKQIESSATDSLSLAQKVKTVGHPDISLPDMYGKVRPLSALGGKVVLLLFWSVTGDAPLLNAEMKELYAKYSGKGFDIYQVCVDTRKAPWVDAVQREKLPWTNVCDLKGAQSPAVKVYNITTAPASYVIDRDGDIVGRDLFGAQLEKKLKELIK